MSTATILILLLGVPIGLLWEYAHKRRDHQKKVQAECSHQWVYHSLHSNGEYWNRTCKLCRLGEIWRDEVPRGAELGKHEKQPHD